VTKPTIVSPGTGVQQRASFTQMSLAPLTTTPGSPAVRGRRLAAPGVVISARSSVAPSSPPSASTSRWTTDCADTWLSPTAA
jgi:hypothetical protein